MIVEICDRCKKLPDPTMVDINILEIEFRPQEEESLADFIGFKRKVSLCQLCFSDFMRFK